MTGRARGWNLAPLAAAAAIVLVPPGAAAQGGAALAANDVHLWRVRAGDTLIGLARALLVDPTRWRALAEVNSLANPNRIRAGSELRIPLALLRSEAVPATVLATGGAVRAEDATTPLSAGAGLGEGRALITGPDGGATVRLVDGTVLRLRADSRLVVRDSRRYPDVGSVRSRVELREGRIEVQTPNTPGGRPGFEVRTPQGVLGVRGTEFRVGASTTEQRSYNEVTEGAVMAEGAAGAQRVAEGFGTVIDAQGRVSPPVLLLAPPDLARLPALQERPLVRFEWPALAGAAGYRVQVAADKSFDRVLAELTLPTPLLRLADLPDGDYQLRVRGADANRLEGHNAEHRFTLKARPEPPLPIQPAPGAKVVGTVTFSWTANPDAATYRLQVARDAAFSDLVVERSGLVETELALPELAPGSYHWRLRSVRASGDAGPNSDPTAFELRALPPPAAPPRAEVGDQGIRLSWPGQPGQQFELEIARDGAFTQRVFAARVAEPGLLFEPPSAGRFHLRLRVLESDGYVGPFSTPQFVDVPPCLRTAERACVRAAGEPVMTLP